MRFFRSFVMALTAAGLIAIPIAGARSHSSVRSNIHPVVMPRAYWSHGRNHAGNEGIPIGVDTHGHIWQYVTGLMTSGDVVRYNRTTKKFIPGYGLTASTGNTIYMSPRPQAWSIWELQWRQGVTRSSFGPTPTNAPRRALAPPGVDAGGQFNDMAVDSHGTAWVAGWASHVWGYNHDSGQAHANGLPLAIPPGRSAIYEATSKATHLTTIDAPAAGPLSGVAISKNGDIWLMDPFKACASGGKKCQGPVLLRYDPKTKKFSRYPIPSKDSPNFCLREPGFHPSENACDIYARTSMSVAPDGSVWTIANTTKGTNILRFHKGKFSLFSTHSRYFNAPLFDRKGHAWMGQTTGAGPGTVLFVNPTTKRVKVIHIRGGTLIQDNKSRLLYVRVSGTKTLKS